MIFLTSRDYLQLGNFENSETCFASVGSININHQSIHIYNVTCLPN